MRDSDREMEWGGREKLHEGEKRKGKVDRGREMVVAKDMCISKGESSYHSLFRILRNFRCLTLLWQVPFLLLAKFKPPDILTKNRVLIKGVLIIISFNNT